MTTEPFLTRKDIARLAGFTSARQVARHERWLGLNKIRIDVNARVKHYPAAATKRRLRKKGYEV